MPETRIEDLRRRVEADPTSIAFAALAEEYRRLGRYQDAVDVCRRGLERHPAYLSARVTLGRALIELDQLEAGARELQHVLASAPENLAAIRALAEVHRRRGELPESIELADDPALVPAPSVVQPPERIPVPVEVAQTAGAESDAIVGRLETFLNAVVAERRRREIAT
ncbi:MAG TPA: tetratricopeptide repeat protein [Vicinamibacterales bacterium]|jgi:tetratricopeptide (TPR) repeat protein|nr:tetratricopeptide repeat protein [Vicinamibacterales bacterium]